VISDELKTSGAGDTSARNGKDLKSGPCVPSYRGAEAKREGRYDAPEGGVLARATPKISKEKELGGIRGLQRHLSRNAG